MRRPQTDGLLKKVFQCFGLASLLLVGNYGDLLGGGADVRMHVPYGLLGICLVEITDILLVAGLLFTALFVFNRTRFYPWIQLMFVVLLPPYLVQRTQDLLPPGLRDSIVPVLAMLWAAFVLLLVMVFPRGYKALLRTADAVGIFLAVFGVCSLMQLMYVMTWRPDVQQITATWSKGPQPARVHPRVVWILFDELSYDQVFEHRAHDLSLPNFDKLRAESTVYTQMQPIGLKTVKVVPSLFSGAVIDDYRYSFKNKLVVHYEGTHGWRPLDGNGTIFADAHRAGWRTAIVGWYNPYCGLYSSALDSCFWTNFDRMDGDVAQRSSFFSNIWRPLGQLGTELRSPGLSGRNSCTFDVQQRYQTYVDLQAHARKLLTDDQADFTYLHFSVPHSPSIWNRADDTFATECGGSYLDNLALADRQLGRLMAILKSSPRWKDTTVIVQGDHSWRTMIWDGMPAWTDEDNVAAQRGFDPRPALIIHLPGQTQAKTDARAMSLLYVHQALESIVQGQAVLP